MSRKKDQVELKGVNQLIQDPAARVYLLIAGAALGVLVVTTFLIGSPLGSAVILCTGLGGLLLRWTAMPVFTTLAVAYLSFAPLGLPIDDRRFSQIAGSSFRLMDLFVIGSLLVYLIGLYRLYTIAQQGMPFEAKAPYVKWGANPTVRAVKQVTDSELIRLFIRVGVAILAGQLLWVLVTNVGLDFRKVPPLKLVEEEDAMRYFRRDYEPPAISNGMNRFLMTSLVLIGSALLLRFVFWYWRLQTLSQDEAKLILTDTAWSEQRREYNRPEKWRAWAKSAAQGIAVKREGGGCLFYVIAALLLLLIGSMMTCCVGLLR